MLLLLHGESIKHSSENVCNKLDGALYFTNKRLAWCKQGEKTPSVEILHQNFRVQQVSKSENKKVMLRVTAVPPDSPPDTTPSLTYTFTWKFTDKDAAVADREKYVVELSVITSKRAQENSNNSHANSATSGKPQSTATSATAAATITSDTPPVNSAAYANVRIGDTPPSAEEMKLRQEVLSKNADLAKLHKSLVVSGLITEDEFWSTRKHILETQAIQTQLRKGESSSWLDLAPSTQESGNFKYTITPNIARRIFKEYPQVKHAYIENVPHKASEKQFWKLFVASQFFNRGRSTDGANRGNRDVIFDKCMQQEDEMFGDSDRFDSSFLSKLLDLTRTEEDSVETGNAPDFTMRAASKDNKLSLIRRFNHHSEIVLQSVLNSKRKQQTTVSSATTEDQSLKDATLLQGLDQPSPEKKIRLNIHDSARYLTSMAKNKEETEGKEMDVVPVRSLPLNVSFDIARSLSKVGNTQSTMEQMSASAHQQAMQQRPNRIAEMRIPDELTRAVAECHGAGTEMLRHLWSLLRLPVTPERRSKAEKIVAAFANVDKHIRETTIKANSMAESKDNNNIGSVIGRMLQPVTGSLQVGKQAFGEKWPSVAAKLTTKANK